MPTLTHRYNASGPIVDFRVGVSAPRRRLLEAQGLDVPPAVIVPLIIDTGADTTLILEQHMRTLGIPPRGHRSLVTSTTAAGYPQELDTYDVSLTLLPKGEDVPFFLPAVEAFGAPLHAGAAEGMIGRDVLEHLTFSIEGRERRFRLIWE